MAHCGGWDDWPPALIACTFFDNAVYLPYGPGLFRTDLDGTVTLVGDYSNIGVRYFHHNIDRGKVGIILDARYHILLRIRDHRSGSLSGNVLKTWNIADIISAAMMAGGDDPSQFVYPSPTDWFHNNGCRIQSGRRLFDRFEPGKFPHLPRL